MLTTILRMSVQNLVGNNIINVITKTVTEIHRLIYSAQCDRPISPCDSTSKIDLNLQLNPIFEHTHKLLRAFCEKLCSRGHDAELSGQVSGKQIGQQIYRGRSNKAGENGQ